jgi:hypothetical protein
MVPRGMSHRRKAGARKAIGAPGDRAVIGGGQDG